MRVTALDLARFLVAAVAGATILAGLYVAKSIAGIDLFEGPSFLHAYLYWR
ncbi:MAG: hypothetical protein RLZ98_2752 [Pseudomonadota bacterium]|jgi:hypothetical protein